MKELGTKMNGREATSKKLKIVKEQWLDKFHCKKVKLEKYLEKRNQKKHYVLARPKILFRLWKQWKSAKVTCLRCRDLLRFGEASGNKSSQCKICCGWKRWKLNWQREQILWVNLPSWMKEVKAELGERANLVSEFAITDDNMKKEITKR